jgi:probable addiction module antidote protein
MKVAKAAKAATRTAPFDVASYLRTPEEQAEYLNAWLEEAPEDAAGFARALGDVARARGMSQVARDSGLSRESLYKALSAEGNPSFATVLKVWHALHLSLRLGATLPGSRARASTPLPADSAPGKVPGSRASKSRAPFARVSTRATKKRRVVVATR